MKEWRGKKLRIWDLEPAKLCRKHLLGEHRELHALWSILANNKNGYSKHPETLRWKGKMQALYLRHEILVVEMQKRGYRHLSPLDQTLATGKAFQDEFVHQLPEQKGILKKKGCQCKTG